MVVGGKREPASDSQLADVGPCSSVLESELGPSLGAWGDDGCGVRLQRWCGVAVQLGRVVLVLQSFPAVKAPSSTIGYNGRGMWWTIA